MDGALKLMKKVLTEDTRSMHTQTDIRDVSMRLRLAMVDEFGREIYLDLPLLKHAEAQTVPVAVKAVKSKE